MTLERLRAGKLRQPEKLASFVLGMCRLVVLEMRRGGARREGLLRTFGDIPDAVEPPESKALDQAELARCLGTLSERERSVVVLSFFADRSADEVARELALTPVNARVIRHRALAKLRQCMTAKEGGR